MRRRLERILVVAGICLPVPLLAITGLSIPLPAAVERIAAALVPWAEASTLDADGFPTGTPGSIVLAAGEGAGREPAEQPDRSALNGSERLPESSNTTHSTPTDDSGGQSKPPVNPGPGPGPGPGGEDPKDEPGLVEGTVDTAEKTLAPVKDEVNSTLDGVDEAVADTADHLLGDLP